MEERKPLLILFSDEAMHYLASAAKFIIGLDEQQYMFKKKLIQVMLHQIERHCNETLRYFNRSLLDWEHNYVLCGVKTTSGGRLISLSISMLLLHIRAILALCWLILQIPFGIA